MWKLPKIAVLLCVAGLAVAVIIAVLRNTVNTPAQAGEKVDVQSALPTESEMPEFDNFAVKSSSKSGIAGSDVMAYRKTDKARLWIVAIVADTEEEAVKWVHMKAVVLQSSGPFSKGSQSGREIGEECWNSNRGNGQPQGSYQIIARAGRAIVSVMLDIPAKRDKTGKPLLRTLLAAKDVGKAENEAIKCLTKLVKMSGASKSAK